MNYKCNGVHGLLIYNVRFTLRIIDLLVFVSVPLYYQNCLYFRDIGNFDIVTIYFKTLDMYIKLYNEI